MFQFTGFPSIRYGLAYGYMRYAHVGFPIQKSPDLWIFAPPRSFSQLVTSFIGSQCLGIHPAPFMLDLFFRPPFHPSVGFRDFPFMNCIFPTPLAKGVAASRLPQISPPQPPGLLV